ncbi:MAG: long-chain fatty acid--CoA ligase [Limnohabitans sp.]|nr:long-chain fatty acid--CoA ligase [Limnohabitans sp.]
MIQLSLPIAWSSDLIGTATRHGNRLAVHDGADAQLTFAQLCQRAHNLAAYLINLGVKLGDCVASCLPNGIDAVWVSYGIKICGAAETPLSWRYTLEELAWCHHLSQFKDVVTQTGRENDWKELGVHALLCKDIPTTPTRLLPRIEQQAWGRMLFTSGTTGKPKAIVYTHGQRWQGEQMQKAHLPWIPNVSDKILLMTPYIHGASLIAFAWLDHGASLILLDGVELEKVKKHIYDPALKAIFAPPTVLAKLCAEFQGQIFPHIQCVFTGTQPLPPALYQKALAIFGPVVRITYGKSECVNPITILTPEQTHAFYTQDVVHAGACVGWPPSGVEIKIEPQTQNNDDDTTEFKQGEIWLRAQQMSLGLIDANGLRMHEPDSWHSTGDLGYIDSIGRVMLTGRIADVIKTGGYRVNPGEIESVLADLPNTSAMCVTSLPSEYWGEVIVAVAESEDLSWVDAAKQKLETISRHKQPRIFFHFKTLPRNPQGKVSRKQVSAHILKTHTVSEGAHPVLQAL